MPDLFEPLRTPDQLTRPPLAPEDVRRRGDRMRRRRTAGAAVGATLAVALVVGGGVALGGGLTAGTAPAPLPPATQAPSDPPGPEGGWRTDIPADFPIAEDLQGPDSAEEELTGPGADVDVFDVPFEACGREVTLNTAEDRLGVRFSGPEHFDGRQLMVYVDEASARKVLLEVTGLYDQCPEHVYPGQQDTVAVSTLRPVDLGDEGYVVERTFLTDGMRSTGLELLHLVRVGNALLVTSLSNEGGSSDEFVADQLRGRNDVLAPVTDALCVFAADGCDDDAPEDPAVALESALLTLDDIRDLTRELRTTWGAAPDGDDTPLGCWNDSVDALEPVAARSRFWQGSARSSGVVNATAATTVVELGDSAAAGRAYDRVVDSLLACDSPDGDELEPTHWSTPSGPAVSRVVTRPAPEVCTECDTGWIDAQAVALVGSRLVLVSVASIGDLQLVPEGPMPDAITRAARRAWEGSDAPAMPDLGPLGVGPVHLGDTAAEAGATGWVSVDGHGEGCTTFTVLTEDGRSLAVGYLDPELGVAAFFASQGVNTPEGVGVGSGPDQVQDVYPGTVDTPAGFRAPVPGHDDRSYFFTFEGGQVMEAALELDGHSCFR